MTKAIIFDLDSCLAATDEVGAVVRTGVCGQPGCVLFGGTRLCAQRQPQHSGNRWGERPREPARQ